MKKNKIIFTVITLIAIIFTTWMIGEIVLRLYCLSTGRGGYVWIPDDYLGVRLVPNSRFVYSVEFSAEYRTRRKTNSLGRIGEEIFVKKPENTTRIIILGDSFTGGLHVDEGKNFCEQLQLLLNQNLGTPNKKFEVVNGGVDGSSPISQYLLYKRELSMLDPDIVILQLFTNDVFEDNKTGAMSIFDSEGMPVKINKYFIQAYLDNPVMENEPTRLEKVIYEVKRYLTNKSVFFQYLSRLPRQFYKKSRLHKKMTNLPEYNDDNQFFIIQDNNPLFKNTYFRNKALANTKKYISAIRDLSEKDNADFLMFYIPVERQLSLEVYGEHSVRLFPEPTNNYFNEKLEELSKEKHINYLDLLPVFGDNKSKGLYYSKDGHTNATGHAVIARALFNFMREEKLI